MRHLAISLFFVGTTFFLSACSPTSPDQPSNSPTKEFLKSATVTGSGDFGVLTLKDSKIVTFRITNDGTEPLVGPPSVDNGEFQILNLSGCDLVALKKVCTIKMSVSGNSLAIGDHVGNLTLDNIVIPLSVSIIDPNPSISFTAGTSLDFGTITNKQSVLKTVTVYNNSLQSVTDVVSVELGNYTIPFDSCSNKILAPQKSCQIKLYFSGSGKSGIIADVLSFHGQTLSLTGVVIPVVDPNPPNNVFLINNTPQTAFNAGIFNEFGVLTTTIYVKNIGLGESPLLTATINNSSFLLVYNQCKDIKLAPNQSCQIKVSFATDNKTEGIYSSIITFGNKTLNLTAQVVFPGVNTYAPNYSVYGECAGNPCAGTGTKVRTISSCKKYKDGEFFALVDNSFCASFAVNTNLQSSCPSPAGEFATPRTVVHGQEYDQCALGSTIKTLSRRICDTDFHDDGAACVADTYSPIYGVASSSLNTVTNICNGSLAVDNPLVGCTRDYDGFSMEPAATYCAGGIPTTTIFQSPAGEFSTPRTIAHGEEYDQCAVGSSIKTFSRRVCSTNFHNDGTACVADTYTPAYGIASAALNTVTATCSGELTVNNPLATCTRDYDLALMTPPATYCGGGTPTTTTFKSPAGEFLTPRTVLNGQEYDQCALGSTVKTFSRRVCSANFHNDGTACVADTYTATYGVATNPVTATCSGSATVNNPLATCTRDYDSAIMTPAATYCTGTPTTTSFQSPAGEFLTPRTVANGQEYDQCSAGSTVKTFARRVCSSNFHDNGTSCVADDYTAEYGVATANPVTAICSGTAAVNNPLIKCTRNNDGTIMTPPATYCTGTPTTTTFQSPAGEFPTPRTVSNGQEYDQCALGSTVKTFSRRVCSNNFHDNGTACIADTYTASYGSFPASSVTAVCSGSQTVSAPLATCLRDHDLNLMIPAATYCGAQTAPTMVYQSPAGTVDFSFTDASGGGFKTYACGLGQNTQTFVYGLCNNNSYSYYGYETGGCSLTKVPTPQTKTFTQIVSGLGGSCALSTEGKAYCWGQSPGDGTSALSVSSYPTALSEPAALKSTTITKLSRGANFTCALTSTGKVYCWGDYYNNFAQLGSYAEPTLYNQSPLNTLTATDISTTGSSICIVAGGQVYCWGYSVVISSNGTTFTNTPTVVNTGAIAGKIVTQVSTTGGTTCAVAYTSTPADAKFYCWGQQGPSGGKLGNGGSSNTFNNTPVAVSTSGVLSGKVATQIDVGQSSVCGVASGQVFCWGSEFAGTGNPSNVPVAITTAGVLSGKTISKVSVSHDISSAARQMCVVDTLGNAYCWSSSAQTYGALGNNPSVASSVPVTVDKSGVLSGKSITDISAGNYHTCSIASGQIYCWGAVGLSGSGSEINTYQLGQGPTVLSSPTATSLVSVVPSFAGNYAVAANPVPNICDGSQTVFTSLLTNTCLQSNTQTIVSDLYCIAINPVGANFQSPAGEFPTPRTVTNGQEYDQCVMGSTVKIFSRRVCTAANTHDNGTSCVADTYTAAYGTAPNTVTAVCAGTATTSKPLVSCTRVHDGALMTPMATYCPGTAPTTTYQSPAGTVNHSFSDYSGGGNRVYSCALGVTTEVYNSGTCNNVSYLYYGGSTGGCALNNEPSPPNYNKVFTQVALGLYGGCGIGDGKVLCWGAMYGSGTDQLSVVSYPTIVTEDATLKSSTIVKLARKELNTCMITNGGKLYCWGAGNLTQNFASAFLGGVKITPFLISETVLNSLNVTDVSVGNNGTICVVASGKEYCWGSIPNGLNSSLINNPDPISYDTGAMAGKTVTQVSVGSAAICAIAYTSAPSDAKIYCWGNHFSGSNLGNGSAAATFSSTPVQVTSTGALSGKVPTQVSVGQNGVCAVASGGVYCWGSEYAAQGVSSNVPVAITTAGVLSGKTVTKVAVGNEHICVVASGGAYCWGRAAVSGQLGNNATTGSDVPVAVSTAGALSGKTVTDIDVADNYSCAVASGQMTCWGRNVPDQYANNSNFFQLGLGPSVLFSNVPVALTSVMPSFVGTYATAINPVTAICSGTQIVYSPLNTGTCTMVSNSLAVSDYYCQLNNPVGVTFQSPAGEYPTPRTITNGQEYDQCALGSATKTLSRRVCTAANTHDSGSACIADTYTATYGTPSPALNTVTNICDGSVTVNNPLATCTRNHDGAAMTPMATYCNGAPTTTTFQSPAGVKSFSILDLNGSTVVGNKDITCPLGQDINSASSTAAVSCSAPGYNLSWASNQKTTTCYAYNKFSSSKSSNTANNHGCYLYADNTVKCSGRNDNGPFGNGTANFIYVTGFNSGFNGSKAISAQGSHTCGLMTDNTVKCAGFNANGATGQGTTVGDTLTATAVAGFSGAKALETGTNHTCAIMSDNSVKCTGLNSNGQLGDTTLINKSTPVTISGFNNARSIFLGPDYTCAILNDNTVKCAGANRYGQMGDGTGNGSNVNNKATPITLSGWAGAKRLFPGASAMCGIMSDDSVKCAGSNTGGQIGNGLTSGVTVTPTAIAGYTGALSMSIGSGVTCAVMSNFSVKCSGTGTYYHNGIDVSSTPVTWTVIGTQNKLAILSEGYGCFLQLNNSLLCVGFDEQHAGEGF